MLGDMMKTNWETGKGGLVYYVTVTAFELVAGSHAGSGHTDNAASCSHAEFLQGKLHDFVLANFGEAVLREVKTAVSAAATHPPFVAQHAQVAQLRTFLDQIPLDESLAGLDKHPETENGFRNYGNAGGYKTVVPSDNVVLTVERDSGDIGPKFGRRGPTFAVKLPGHASAVVAWQDHFFLVVSNSYTVLDPRGRHLHTSHQPDFGTLLRITNVYKRQERIFFAYRWFHQNYPDGFLQFQVGRGFTGRMELTTTNLCE